MPKGIAGLFSTLHVNEMFMQIETFLNTKDLRLELPETNKVQVWTTEGEMLHIEKQALLQNSTDLSSYLIQFWWPQMDDISIKLVPQGHLCECDIYLDGLDKNQTKDILDILIGIALHSRETVGFFMDREELASGYDWSSFFKEYSDSSDIKLFGLKLFKKYEIKVYNAEQLKGIERDCVYVAIPGHNRGIITLYLLCQG